MTVLLSAPYGADNVPRMQDFSPFAHVPLDHFLRYPTLVVNGKPEGLGPEKHPKVCTEGTEPLAPQGRETVVDSGGLSWSTDGAFTRSDL
ncbi:MAG: hypothetical protein C7B43_00580 [Sulfobacillus benefaciens]|uniref:Uncharacterized protein n=1 Tax=Sulfobacillus benefaciens TaxID=453960 RepID=A0A2T2XB74_9FIRM|nr:MAG: hypothetical protein C7B43_00580 [Sulfobacillus benefaciens]